MNQKQRKFPCVYMRGGTSKAVFFHKEDLPADEKEWKENETSTDAVQGIWPAFFLCQ